MLLILASPALLSPRLIRRRTTRIACSTNAQAPLTTPLAPRHLRAYAAGELYPTRIVDRNSVECYALSNADAEAERGPQVQSVPRVTVNLGGAAAWDRARVGFLFGLWYLLSVVYSVKNKQAHMALALPNLIATAQLVVGSAIALFWWATKARAPPTLTAAALRTLLPIGLFHGVGHLTGVYATAAGSVSFVQVVKSGGPVWAAILSGLLLRQSVSRRVWLSMLPICGGIALASAKELAFVWSAFLAAAASDIALALRNVLSKASMNRPQAGNMTPQNSFYVFTCLSCLICLPIAAALEAGGAAAAWAAAAPTAADAAALLRLIAAGGLYFTAYSEVQFLALSNISPVTHAVGNTMRRVVIMLVTIAVFGTPVSVLGGVGSAIAIAGTYAYAATKTYEQRQADAARLAAAGSADAPADAPAGRTDHPLLPAMKMLGRML